MSDSSNKTEMIEQLKQLLLTTKHSKTLSGGNEVAVRCPFCGDSKKSNNPHFYISMVKDGHSYDCKKCPAQSEVLTKEVLTMLGLIDITLFEYLKTFESVKIKKTIDIDSRFTKLNVNVYDKVLKRDQFKIDLYSQRMKTDMSTKENLERYRIVTNLGKLMEVNGIEIPEKDKDTVKFLSENYMGFLSAFNNIVALDKVTNVEGERKMMFPLSNRVKIPFLYMINNGIDPLSPHPKIAIGEGCSDVIGASMLYYARDDHNIVYVATGSGGAYKNALQTTLALTCFFGCQLDIYSDNDVPISQYESMLRGVSQSFSDVNIIYNKAGKDFGDMNKPIEPKVMKMR